MVNAAAVSIFEVGDKVESVGESERDGYACEAVRVIADGVGKGRERGEAEVGVECGVAARTDEIGAVE